MAVKLAQGFQITSASPIDSRLVLTKAQMLAYNLNLMPEIYLALCTDDKKFYIFDKTVTPSTETVYFIPYEEKLDIPAAIAKSMSSETGKAAIEQAVATTLPGAMAKTLADPERAEELVENMFDNEQFALNVNNKVELQVDKAIQCIEAIDGMA